MKKQMISILSAAALTASFLPIFAAEPADYTVTLNGESAVSCQVYQESGVIMIPVRQTAEALGFTVTWNEASQAVGLDNGVVKTALTLGSDSYYKASSALIGMSAPMALGAAPQLIQDLTYVPASLFDLLLGQGAVAVKDSAISISAPEEAGSGTQGNVEIPNPMVSYASAAEAMKAAKLSVKAPETLGGLSLSDSFVITGGLLHFVYGGGEARIIYRAAKAEGDITGDYTVYEDVQKTQINGQNITLKGSGGAYSVITWEKDGVSYAVMPDESVSADSVSALISALL